MKLNLNTVTVVSINGRDPEKSIKALDISSEKINFNKKLLITNKNINVDDTITCKTVSGLNSLEDYNLFCFKELYKYIETEHCLLVQPDGFVINPNLWSDFFLEYDYIGALWDRNLVNYIMSRTNMETNLQTIMGNGGFSLRSKKLLEETSKLEYTNCSLEEDVMICVVYRKFLKEKGLKFASNDIAQQFSMETYINEKSIIGNTFGFHGNKKYFPQYQKYYDLIEK